MIRIDSDQGLSTSSKKYAYFWDYTEQVLTPGDTNVFGITLKADRTASGTKLFKIIINDTNTSTSFASKTFFVKFI